MHDRVGEPRDRLARRPEGEPSLADFELVETSVLELDGGEVLVCKRLHARRTRICRCG